MRSERRLTWNSGVNGYHQNYTRENDDKNAPDKNAEEEGRPETQPDNRFCRFMHCGNSSAVVSRNLCFTSSARCR